MAERLFRGFLFFGPPDFFADFVAGFFSSFLVDCKGGCNKPQYLCLFAFVCVCLCLSTFACVYLRFCLCVFLRLSAFVCVCLRLLAFAYAPPLLRPLCVTLNFVGKSAQKNPPGNPRQNPPKFIQQNPQYISAEGPGQDWSYDEMLCSAQVLLTPSQQMRCFGRANRLGYGDDIDRLGTERLQIRSLLSQGLVHTRVWRRK